MSIAWFLENPAPDYLHVSRSKPVHLRDESIKVEDPCSANESGRYINYYTLTKEGKKIAGTGREICTAMNWKYDTGRQQLLKNKFIDGWEIIKSRILRTCSLSRQCDILIEIEKDGEIERLTYIELADKFGKTAASIYYHVGKGCIEGYTCKKIKAGGV